jgi:hypothetical protein
VKASELKTLSLKQGMEQLAREEFYSVYLIITTEL